ncbi:Dynamin [Penicillium sp. IBT 31633x]|nr:Dynamin [Penicillium sp. IBT 31633x]
MSSSSATGRVAFDSGQFRCNINLHSFKTSKRMSQVDRIRANGVDNIIALPQLVISGDQSAGKSSVLDGITGIPFPRLDGLCNRLPTEIILRHARLNAYHHHLRDFEELPKIIEQAAKLMGVRGSDTNAEGPAVAADVLRLELVGDTGLHLRIVDLPGDRVGVRTVGIITKPDLISEGTKSRIAYLAKNCDHTKLNLRWFLLKNPSPAELKEGITLEGRRKAELTFFATGGWKEQGHIERELPKVREDVRRVLRDISEELGGIGTERKSSTQIQQALRGHTAAVTRDFSETSRQQLFVRLRAVVHNENKRFSDHMSQYGKKRKVVEVSHSPDHDEEGPLLVTAEEMLEWIRQSSRWSLIARNHINVVSKIVSQFMNLALAHVIKDVEVRENMDCLIRAVLEAYVEASESELARLLEDETRHPITYNHNYTENIQKGRDQKSKSHLEQSQRNSIQIDLFASRRRSVVVDMKEQACLDAQIDLNAYYKVAKKTFVDNITRQVIERHIVAKLADAFNPITVSCYSDEELVDLATVPPKIGHRRSEMYRVQRTLKQSFRDLAER